MVMMGCKIGKIRQVCQRFLMAGIAMAFVFGCTPQLDYSYEPAQEEELLARVLGDAPPEFDRDILKLSPEIKAILDSEIDRSWNGQRKLDRLRQMLFDDNQLDIQYDAFHTLTATETFNKREGNCLSLTTLTVAAARYVGLEANFQTIEVQPTWDRDGKTLIRYEHIVATGNFDFTRSWTIDFLPEFIVGDQRTEIISDDEALALYYNNLGAENIVDGRTHVGIRYLRKALHLKPNFPDAWNNIGAGLRRDGQHELAEFAYHKAIQQDGSNYSALSNLAQFYKARHRFEEAEELQRAVEGYRSRNPYFNFFIAQVLMKEGNLEEATAYLQRSIRQKRDEPDFYEAIAKVYERQGNAEQSEEMLVLAEKYRSGELTAPPRRNHHRFWTTTLNVN